MKHSTLFITFGDFKNPTDGGSKFTHEIIAMLTGIEGSVETLSYYDHSSIKSKIFRKALSILISLALKLPLPVSYFYSYNLIKLAKKKIRAKLYSSAHPQKKIRVFVDHLELCYLTTILRKMFGDAIEIIHISHNIEPKLLKQRLGEGLVYKYSQFCCQYSLFERESLRQVDTIISISDEEREHFAKLNPASSPNNVIKAITIPPTFSYFPLHKCIKELPHKKIVFIASFDWWPNLEAFQWIRDQLAPKLPSDFKIHVYGKNSMRHAASAPENIIIHGYVENILEVWEDCLFSIAPISQGAGVNIKVAESLHNNTPVIGTSLSFNGISKDYLNGAIRLELNVEKWVEALEFYSKNKSSYKELRRSISYPSKDHILEQLRLQS